jgi:hypothetical protein
MTSRPSSDDVAPDRPGPNPLNRLVSALIGGGLGLVLGGVAASRLGVAHDEVPWVAIGAGLLTFLAFCAAFFLRRPRSPS